MKLAPTHLFTTLLNLIHLLTTTTASPIVTPILDTDATSLTTRQDTNGMCERNSNPSMCTLSSDYNPSNGQMAVFVFRADCALIGHNPRIPQPHYDFYSQLPYTIVLTVFQDSKPGSSKYPEFWYAGRHSYVGQRSCHRNGANHVICLIDFKC